MQSGKYQIDPTQLFDAQFGALAITSQDSVGMTVYGLFILQCSNYLISVELMVSR
jgi:hypothetical protein